MKPTLIFDMDGVLVNTSNSYNKLRLEAYKHFTGQDTTVEEVNEVKRLGGYNNDWDLLIYLAKKNGFEIKIEELMEYYGEKYCNKNFEGYINDEEPILSKEYIEKLSKDFNLTIFTGRYGYEARYSLERFGTKDYFSQIICFEEVGIDHQKPDNKGVEIIKSNISSDRIYYMGDTVDDMIAAKSSNVLGIGCLPPHDKSQTLINRMKDVGAYAILNSTTELWDFLQKDLQTVNA